MKKKQIDHYDPKMFEGRFSFNNIFTWLGIGLVAIATILYMIAILFGNTIPLNTTIFFVALVGIGCAVFTAIRKIQSWTDWHIIIALVMGAFICFLTAVTQIQAWIPRDNTVSPSTSPDSSQPVDDKSTPPSENPPSA